MKNKPATIRSTGIRNFIRMHFLGKPLYETKIYNSLVLDISCGWGMYFKINPYATGIDLDDNCIDFLQKQGYKAIKGDILKTLPFNDEQFKCAIAQDVLEHFELAEAEIIMNETHRILQKRGLFLIVIPNKRGFEYGLKRNVGHKHYIVPKEVVKLGENKFILKKCYSYPFSGLLGILFTHNKEVLVLEKL